MKIKANKRPRMVRGMLSCRCCDDLYDKPYKLDKQMLKELIEDLQSNTLDCDAVQSGTVFRL